jgi:hypothetical protein
VKPFSFVASIISMIVATVAFAGAFGPQSLAVAATPPPTPPPIGTPATTEPNPSLGPDASPQSYGSPGPYASPEGTLGPSPSPPPGARKGIEGVWEVQIQRPNTTDYTHFKLTQDGSTLSGTYLDARGKKYPLTGTIDGQAVRLIVTMPNGTTLLLEGKLDGTTDMIGMLTMPDGALPFTAAYRAKAKWIENVNPSPGGIPSTGGYTPP